MTARVTLYAPGGGTAVTVSAHQAEAFKARGWTEAVAVEQEQQSTEPEVVDDGENEG